MNFGSLAILLFQLNSKRPSISRKEVAVRFAHYAGLVLFCSWGALCDAASSTTVEVIPANPRYLEPVYVRITPPELSSRNTYASQVSVRDGVIHVNYVALPEIGAYSYDVLLGRFPTGSYTVSIEFNSSQEAMATFTVGEAPHPVTFSSSFGPSVDYTGLWWSPAQPGWGLSVHQGPTQELFAIWFDYDAAGNPVWYTLQPGTWDGLTTAQTFEGPVYKSTGPWFGGVFDPAGAHATQVGTGSVTFFDAKHGTLSFTVDGVNVELGVERDPIE